MMSVYFIMEGNYSVLRGMPDYTNYTFDDFVQDDRFRSWVLTESPTEQIFWNRWLQANPEKVDTVLAARQFVRQMQQAQEELSDEELADESSRIRLSRLTAVNPPDEEPAAMAERTNRFLWSWGRIAAMIAVVSLGALGYVYWHSANGTDDALVVYEQHAEQQGEKIQEVRNITNASQLVRLPDGSKVTLYRNSQLRFPRQFSAGRREVFLVGEAFFDVVRQPKHPFMVYTRQLTTQVLGTSFGVRAYADDKEAKVVVRTGKVSVFKTPPSGTPTEPPPAIILTPNQQVTYQQTDDRLERSLVALPEPVAAVPGHIPLMAFEHTPVVRVFKRLEATYGITINYDNDLLADCELTADFGSESLFERLDLICRATQSRYEVIDAQIIIYSKGCQ